MNFRSTFGQHLYENRYLYLFLATILQVFLVSFFPDRNALFINELTFSIFMLANINFIRHSRRIVLVMIFFGILSIFLAWVPAQSDIGQNILPWKILIVVLFIIVIIYQIVSQMVSSKIVDAKMILGVITIYILFGLIAGECNQLVYHFDHNAFSGAIDPSDNADLRYYSYVTITTLGYGDIAPVSQIARASAVFFSLTGQVYLAVVIALIVGKYVSYTDKKDEDEEKKEEKKGN